MSDPVRHCMNAVHRPHTAQYTNDTNTVKCVRQS